MSDLSELKRLAEAATPGPWSLEVLEKPDWYDEDDHAPGDIVAEDGSSIHGNMKYSATSISFEDCAFIAAANPATILSLIAEVERLKRACIVTRDECAEAEHSGFRRGIEAAAKVVRPAIEAIPMDRGERVFCLQVGERIEAAIRAIWDTGNE